MKAGARVGRAPLVAWDARLVGGTNTGDSTHWTSLLSALRREPGDLRFALFAAGPAPDEFRPDDRFQWITVPAPSSRWWSLVSFPLAALRAGANIVHVQYSLSPLVRTPAVTTVHDISFFTGPQWFRPRDRAIMRLSVPAACRRAHRVVTVSETSRREIDEFIPDARGKVRVIPNACPDWIHPLPRKAAQREVAARLGVSEPYMLTVGTRWPRKNMELAVAAADGLPADLPHRLLVTGKSGSAESLGHRGIATGYVDTETLSALYSAADLYLAPSRHEGFGIPLLEAFRCGCPVLCSTGGALPEVAGDAAQIEASWAPADWSATAERLLRDPGTLDSLRDRGRARERHFTWEDAARKLRTVYREVLE